MNEAYRIPSIATCVIFAICGAVAAFTPSQSGTISALGLAIVTLIWNNAKANADTAEKVKSTAADMAQTVEQTAATLKAHVSETTAIQADHLQAVANQLEQVAHQTNGLTETIKTLATADGFAAGVKSETDKKSSRE